MTYRLTLTKRYMLFVTAVVAVMLVCSYLITSAVVRSGLKDLFRQRLDRARLVLDRYFEIHYLSKMDEWQTVLSSPRFLASSSSHC